MMGSLYEGDEDCRFFDALEEIASPSNSLESDSFSSEFGDSVDYKVWAKTPRSVQERRSKFLDLIGLDSEEAAWEKRVDDGSNGQCKRRNDRIMQNSGAVLRSSGFEEQFSSSSSLLSSLSCRSNNCFDVTRETGSIVCRDEKEHNQNQLFQFFGLETLDQLRVPRGFDRTLSLTSTARQALQREAEGSSTPSRRMNIVKNKWLSRLRSVTCTVDKNEVANNFRHTNSCPKRGAQVQRVKVRHCRKRWKELSALFIRQDFQAHEGSILTMKFSLDGQYLATAGKDGVVRVWQVVEDIRSDLIDIPELDTSCMYFTMNHLSELAPCIKEREKMDTLRKHSKTEDLASVIFPPRVFRILEEPLHQFFGHSGEILDLSWSKNNCLLSSSVDKTVRLWRVGCQQCVKVFPHSNYVTCIQFNPVDDNQFISGSIDGKVRIWEIGGRQVVDWADVREIISAVCYRPSGQGVVVGCIRGVCRFYDISDDRFQLEARICLESKKKAPSKRITGFQFLPQEPGKLMVTSADSKVRILMGTDVVCKFKGDRSSGNQLFASFTSDGKHIISTSENSGTYIWDSSDHGDFSPAQPKLIKSWECFPSNASVAIPWCGLKSRKPGKGFQLHFLDGRTTSPAPSPLPFPACLSLSQDLILEFFPKASATWPEEKLFGLGPRALTSTMVHKYQSKFLTSSCQRTSVCHAWDLVIVAAGQDGRITSFHNYGLPVAL